MIAIRLPEHIAILNSNNLLQQDVLDYRSREVILHKNYLIAAGLDKTVKVYKNLQLTFTLNLIKKVKRITINESDEKVYICDKHGDIWSFPFGKEGIEQITKDQSPIQTNLAIPKCFQYLEIKGQKIIVLGDSYCKIKIFNANNIDEILYIWVPFEGFLKQIILDTDYVVMLFKRFDEHENHYFEIYRIKQDEFFQESPVFERIFNQQFTEEVQKIHLLSQQKIVVQYKQNAIKIIQQLENQQNQEVVKEFEGTLVDVSKNNQLLSIKASQEVQQQTTIKGCLIKSV